MSGVNLSGAADWLQHINKLKYIIELSLVTCSLSNIPYSLSHVNFTSLRILELGANGPFGVPVPAWLSNLTDLSYLDLNYCGFHGKIPDALGNLASLSNLLLGYNRLDGTVPESLRNLCNLRVVELNNLRIGGDVAQVVETSRCSWKSLEMLNLENNELRGNLSGWLEQLENVSAVYLSNNSLVGTIPFGIRNLSNLRSLDLSFNSLQGVVSEAHFANLSNLKAILLSSNSLVIDVDENWVPPFQLMVLMLGSCELGSRFPAWLRWQTQLDEVDLSNTSISGTVPEWFWNSSATSIGSLSFLTSLHLNDNRFYGEIPTSLQHCTDLILLDLSRNRFSGQIPAWALFRKAYRI
ncbi:Leucine-rich repeat receptor-like protein kinase PEPR2 [Ananas comosus]|uniref:Leucine-rich repeat receptor-like protein kinase PEPR2 n=1 Tax=Ananas comosus TaxID=4615 RepID=A0A199USG0_ANACO|nr:Leucine-rich repeat receptor-like protein kinase PEPR2 [Ananas comosus]